MEKINKSGHLQPRRLESQWSDRLLIFMQLLWWDFLEKCLVLCDIN